MRDLPRMAETMRAIRRDGSMAASIHTARNGWTWITLAGTALNSQCIADLTADGWLQLHTEPPRQPMRLTITAWPKFAGPEPITRAELAAALNLETDRDADNWT